MASYSRKRDVHHVNSDSPKTFKQHLTTKTLKNNFNSDRRMIWYRTEEYIPDVSKSMATAYKLGIDLFPSHFDYSTKSFEIHEPKVLRDAKKAKKKQAAFIEGVLNAIVSDGQMDRLAVLIIGLANSQKIPHWVGYQSDVGLADTAFSETDADSDAD
mgnify:CR=1 FL=1